MPRRKKDKPAEAEESFHALNARMTVKIRENILSGRWPAETMEEKRLLREHLEQQEKKAERKRKRKSKK
jgi:hypothetical protein|tara:strand:+ start:541 stop:747 length:207 start_codon:yes stop_codon:yes gene_type:complete